MKYGDHWLAKRSCGALLHPSSLPSQYGIGNLGQTARDWIDFLSDSGFSFWQTCPVGPTGFGDSPYQVFASSAGNPYFIDWEPLLSADYIPRDDLQALQSESDHVEFGHLYRTFFPILRKAFSKFKQNPALIESKYGKLSEFVEKEAHWLESFATFQALKLRNNLKPWWQWTESDRNPNNAPKLGSAELEEFEFQIFSQYLFRAQWRAIRSYAKSKGVSIIGDLPIYVAPDSADAWSNRALFQISETGEFNAVAGVPPDYFNERGQLWGNPLYEWDKHKESDFDWWTRRIRDQLDLFDVIRIDHFRAFHDFWTIPYHLQDARKGNWHLGPGQAFWDHMRKVFPDLPFLAEDLGDVSEEVRKLRISSGLPGMAVLQFAFDGMPDNLYIPHNLTEDLVLYTGTHDNDTSLGWYDSSDEKTRFHFRAYLNVDGSSPGWDMLRMAYRTVSKLVVIPAQDLLSLNSDARFNVPGKASGNWTWRMSLSQFNQLRNESTDYLKSQALVSGRLHQKSVKELAGSDE